MDCCETLRDATGTVEGRPLRPRDVKELLRLRGALLTGRDRALIEMYLDSGETVRRIATLAAVTPSCVARRIRTITRRLADPTYSVCLANRQDFTTTELRIVKEYFVRGLSIQRISRRWHLSRHRVRKAIRKARACTTAAARAAHVGTWKGQSS